MGNVLPQASISVLQGKICQSIYRHMSTFQLFQEPCIIWSLYTNPALLHSNQLHNQNPQALATAQHQVLYYQL
jgi:hypothetical protein